MIARTYIAILSLALLVGCATIGPQKVETDRSDYGYALGESWKEQVLLNIVKIRYHEWPLFLSVDQVVTQYTQEHSGVVGADVRKPWQGDFNIYELGYSGKFNERPTVKMSPLRGLDYAVTMLRPMNPATLFALIEAGWPAKQILRIGVGSINGRHNDHFEFGVHYRADPEFARLNRLLNQVQREGAITVDIVISEEKTSSDEIIQDVRTTAGRLPTEVRLNIEERFLDAETTEELRQVKIALGLDPDRDRFRIVYGDDHQDSGSMVVETRSILQVMASLASYVQVPQSDIDEGRVAFLHPVPEEDVAGFAPLMQVQSGEAAPEDAYIAVPYRDIWFWIAGNDNVSKRTFAFLSVMMNVIETDSTAASGQVVIPVREKSDSPNRKEREEKEDEEEISGG